MPFLRGLGLGGGRGFLLSQPVFRSTVWESAGQLGGGHSSCDCPGRRAVQSVCVPFPGGEENGGWCNVQGSASSLQGTPWAWRTCGALDRALGPTKFCVDQLGLYDPSPPVSCGPPSACKGAPIMGTWEKQKRRLSPWGPAGSRHRRELLFSLRAPCRVAISPSA